MLCLHLGYVLSSTAAETMPQSFPLLLANSLGTLGSYCKLLVPCFILLKIVTLSRLVLRCRYFFSLVDEIASAGAVKFMFSKCPPHFAEEDGYGGRS